MHTNQLLKKTLASFGACRVSFVSLGASIVLALLITSSISKAQCPTDIVPTDSAWTSGGM